MKSRIAQMRFIDIGLYVFFLIGVIIFLIRSSDKLQSKNVGIHPPTELQITFDTLINFGQVTPLKMITFKGFVKNKGQNKLHIGNLKTSCGCTNFSVVNPVVNPGDSTMISFNIKTLEQVRDIVSLNFEANTKKANYKIEASYNTIK
jgi:Protein of unknown function (DUF1573)